MNLYVSFVRSLFGLFLALGGAMIFLYGLITFAVSKGNSPQSFGAVLFGYGCALIGVYVHTRLRQLAEDSLATLRRITDRFFDI